MVFHKAIFHATMLAILWCYKSVKKPQSVSLTEQDMKLATLIAAISSDKQVAKLDVNERCYNLLS